MDEVGVDDRWIPEVEYNWICERVPIVCVDLLPLIRGADTFGLIDRDTYEGGHGLCLIGGAVLLDEPLTDALVRHVETTLGPNVDLYLESLNLVGIYQYYRRMRQGELHDLRKNAVAITYTGYVSGECEALGEAKAFHTFPLDEPPAGNAFGFGQRRVAYEALATVNGNHERR